MPGGQEGACLGDLRGGEGGRSPDPYATRLGGGEPGLGPLDDECPFELGQGTEHTELPEPLAMAVFRIFQEMLSNVARHARASHVQVHIAVHASELSLLVRDNGCGASADAFDAPTAYGVMGMRERARQLGGQLHIHSEPGRGSCLRLLIPRELA